MTSRSEEMLTAIAEGSIVDSEPQCRKEQFLKAIANGDTSDLPEPMCREEELLLQIAQNGTGGGGEIVTEDISITPTTSEQVIKRSSGKYINQVTVDAVTSAIDSNIKSENIAKGVSILGVEGSVTPSAGTDRLQWKCDNMKSLEREFFKGEVEGIDDIIAGLDTSKVSNFSYAFARSSLKRYPDSLDLSSAEDLSHFCEGCNFEKKNLVISNLPNVTTLDTSFGGCYGFDIATVNNLPKIVSMYALFQGLGNGPNWLYEAHFDKDTVKPQNVGRLFNARYYLKIVTGLNLINCTSSTSYAFNNCSRLEEIELFNIKVALQIGSGTSYGHLLTLDSLINTVKELWDYSSGTSTYTLTMGSANLSKIANTYVKLVDVTDEMLAADQYAANKLPCVVCESTDEGAMTLTDYAGLKSWQLA